LIFGKATGSQVGRGTKHGTVVFSTTPGYSGKKGIIEWWKVLPWREEHFEFRSLDCTVPITFTPRLTISDEKKSG